MGKPPAAQGKIVTWVDGGKYKETNFSWDEVCQYVVPLVSSMQ